MFCRQFNRTKLQMVGATYSPTVHVQRPLRRTGGIGALRSSWTMKTLRSSTAEVRLRIAWEFSLLQHMGRFSLSRLRMVSPRQGWSRLLPCHFRWHGSRKVFHLSILAILLLIERQCMWLKSRLNSLYPISSSCRVAATPYMSSSIGACWQPSHNLRSSAFGGGAIKHRWIFQGGLDYQRHQVPWNLRGGKAALQASHWLLAVASSFGWKSLKTRMVTCLVLCERRL